MVSVLINNYNYENYIGEAIDSVLRQTWKDWELIIVDDGSADDSKEVIDRYVQKYPDKIQAVYKENGGQASCFNAGYALANGDIIAFLDSDDYWYDNKLERIVEMHKKSDFVAHGKYYSQGDQDRIIMPVKEERVRLLREYALFPTYKITTSTMSCTRALGDKIFPMPEEEFRICADHFVTFSAQYYCNTEYTYDHLSFYRIHGDNQFVAMSEELRMKYCADLDYICIEYFNKSIENTDLPPVPHRTKEMDSKLKEEIGEGFKIEPDKKYVIYGLKNKSKRMIEEVTWNGGRIYCFTDSDSAKWGSTFYTHRVIPPQRLVEERANYDKIIIASSYFYEIEDTLKGLGFKRGHDYMYHPL